MVKRLAFAAGAFWVARWLAAEVASFAGHRLLRPGPPPRASSAVPGVMPIPSDEVLRKGSEP
jgi:hypothetical protein